VSRTPSKARLQHYRYEAVAQGLAAIQGNEWVAGIAHGFNFVKVSFADVHVA